MTDVLQDFQLGLIYNRKEVELEIECETTNMRLNTIETYREKVMPISRGFNSLYLFCRFFSGTKEREGASKEVELIGTAS